jgi:hypothetical protein
MRGTVGRGDLGQKFGPKRSRPHALADRFSDPRELPQVCGIEAVEGIVNRLRDARVGEGSAKCVGRDREAVGYGDTLSLETTHQFLERGILSAHGGYVGEADPPERHHKTGTQLGHTNTHHVTERTLSAGSKGSMKRAIE